MSGKLSQDHYTEGDSESVFESRARAESGAGGRVLPLSEAGLVSRTGERGAAAWTCGEPRRLCADVRWLLSLANFSIIDSSSLCT